MFRIGGHSTDVYPAGANPWNGNLLQVRPGYTYFTPAQVPAGEELNYFFASMSDAAATGVTVPAASWKHKVTASTVISTSVFCSAYFDPIDSLWYCGLSKSSGTSTSDVMQTNGIDAESSSPDWATVSNGSGVGAGRCVANIFDGTHHFMAVVRQSDGAAFVYTCVPGGAWTFDATVFPYTSGAYEGAAACIFDGQVVITFCDGVGTGGSKAFTTAAGAAISWSYPIIAPLLVATNLAYMAASPTILVSMANGLGVTTYATTPDASTWTQRTLPGAFAHSDQITGLCYSSSDQRFICTTSGSDAKGHVYISFDGLAWTEQGTGFASIPGGITTVAATDAGCILGLGVYGSLADPIYSVDCGLTWYFTTLQMSTSGSISGQGPLVATSGVNFFCQTAGLGRFSESAGLSRSRA